MRLIFLSVSHNSVLLSFLQRTQQVTATLLFFCVLPPRLSYPYFFVHRKCLNTYMGLAKNVDLRGISAKSYAWHKLRLREFPQMSFSNSVILEWQIGRKNKNNFHALDARIVAYLATVSSGVRSRPIFICRKSLCYVLEDHLDHGDRNRQLNSLQMKNKNSENILVFFPCRLVPSLNTKLRIKQDSFFDFLDTIFF